MVICQGNWNIARGLIFELLRLWISRLAIPREHQSIDSSDVLKCLTRSLLHIISSRLTIQGILFEWNCSPLNTVRRLVQDAPAILINAAVLSPNQKKEK
jgi:hypothetical protein